MKSEPAAAPKAKLVVPVVQADIDDGLDKQRHTRPHPGVKSQVHLAKNIMKWFFK